MPPLRQILPLDRWNAVVFAAAGLLLAGVVCLDFFSSWTLLLLYLVPPMTVAWLVRGYWWLVMTLLATVLWLAVRCIAPPPEAMINGVRESWQQLGWILITARLGPMLLVAFLCSRLRHFSRSPNSFTSSHDNTGLLSMMGLRETLSRRHTVDLASGGPVAMLLLDVERKVSAFGGQSTEHAALVGAVIGKLLLTHSRAADLCVRVSPNHFLVIMLNSDRSVAATLDAAVQDALPEITRTLDNSVSVSTLLLYCPGTCPSLDRMRSHAVNRLVTLKVLGQGHHLSEEWRPTA